MFKSFSALYVEDEKEIKETVHLIMGKMFREFFTASTGKEGLDFYIENKDDIDIIITDINMPEMDGLTMSERIREIDPSIPIIITTAHNDKNFLHKAIEVGVSRFVLKPLDLKKLVKEVDKSIEPLILKRDLDREIKEHLEERIQNAKFKAIGELSAGITHEINTPLTYIKASFELMNFNIEDLAESTQKENIKTNIEHIEDGIGRIENIINSMKEMFNQSTMQKEDCNIYSTVATSIVLSFNKSKHISKIYLNNKEFSLNSDKEEESYLSFVEKQRIEQVWVIIINNAMDELVKIKEYEKRRLDINILEEREFISVYFKDNAGGIKNDVIEELFDPFKGTKESSGMGVGLSIAKKILDDQNAKIEVYNEDEGAVFKVSLKKSK